MPFEPLRFEKNALKVLDQRQLPEREVWLMCQNSHQVWKAIREMAVRGAPAIGIAGAYGLYLGVAGYQGTRKGFVQRLRRESNYLKSARPTGVNLRNALDRITDHIERLPTRDVQELQNEVLHEAISIHEEDNRLCREIGRHGARLFRSGDKVLTYCNAGGLATSGYGTALGVLYTAHKLGRKISVYASETRPLLQGARLTAWELVKSRIPCTLLCDNSVASLMQAGQIDRVIVGADRIAANGDTANKIGTYNLAVLAKAHGIPFYVAAPATTFDFTIPHGRFIPIEERGAMEVTHVMGRRIAPRGVRVKNPAFDMTPHRFITAFITELGVLHPPFRQSLKKISSCGTKRRV